MAPRLKVLVFDAGEGLCLFVRLPGGQRMVADCTGGRGAGALAFLRARGEVGPLSPLSAYLRPERDCAGPGEWLALLGLLRGLVLRPGGAWLYWRPARTPEPGFSLSVRVSPRGGPRPPAEAGGCGPPLVLGLSAAQVSELGGGPAAWVANSSPAVMLPGNGRGDFLLAGDLRAGAWQRLLADPALGGLLCRVVGFGAGEPEGGWSLGRGLLMACLPFLALGALSAGCWALPGPGAGRAPLATPEVGALGIEVEEDGLMRVDAWPQGDNRLTWRGLARPLADPALPAPWPLRRALAGGPAPSA